MCNSHLDVENQIEMHHNAQAKHSAKSLATQGEPNGRLEKADVVLVRVYIYEWIC